MTTRRVLLASTSLLAVAVLAGSARANNCPAQTASVAELRPVSGATNVPLNTVIAFGTHPAFAPYDPAVSITSNGGAAIPGALETGPAGVWIFRPNGTLAPNTTYDVS
ncbi:MAG TPA: Ig-like domain-containing protein, partial [bacterium]|nr:Ig-like domain-containing protein [bacterium]